VAQRREPPRSDPRLARAAADLVRVTPPDGRPSNEVVQAALWLNGIVEPPPHLILASMTSGPGGEQAMLAELRTQLPRALSQGRYRRVGAAARPLKDETLVIVALQETGIELEPVARSIFALPWLGHTLVGTTDNDYEGPLDHIEPSDADVHYLLDAVNEFFGRALTPADLTGAFAGVRPLISTGDPKKSVDISRKAELYETSSGMITITGGKLTTWRRMAKMTVDRIVEREARDAPCRTNEIPLGQAIAVQELQRVEGVPEESYAALASRYGHAAHDVLALAGARGELAQPIVDGLPDLLAEVALAARREQALSIGDALLRRTRLGLLAARELAGPVADGSSPAADGPVARVADVLAGELGWDVARKDAELEAFAREASAEGIVRS